MIILLLTHLVLPAQVQRAAHWYFGTKAGLDFSTGMATADISGQMETIEGSAAISGTAGNLLFYSDGTQVWNNLHQVMPNSVGLIGSQSSAQSCIIVPQPGGSSLYYLFTTSFGFTQGVYYSMIDMTLNNGLGDVNATKNVQLYIDATEEIAATRHCNDIDYWVVTRELATNVLIFHAWLVTSAGVNSAVTTSINVPTANWNGVGGLTFSQDGTMLVFSSFDTPVYIYSFNKSTGQITNGSSVSGYPNEMIYSNALSPDKTKLYITTWGSFANSANCYLSQFDLSSPNVQGSRVNLDSVDYSNGSPNGYGYMGQVRLGPDQKIYCDRWHQRYPQIFDPNWWNSLDSLGVVNAPNLAGILCNYQQNGICLNGRPTLCGLPNFVSNFTSTVMPVPIVMPTLSVNSATVCSGTNVSLSVTASPPGGLTYTWLPGGSQNYSLALFPATSTVYTVHVNKGCLTTSLTSTVTISNSFTLSVSSSTICGTGTVTLTTGNLPAGTSYTWLPGGINTSVLVVSPSVTTQYSLFTMSNGCSNSGSLNVFVNSQPTLSVNNPTICFGTSTLLTVSGASGYTWYPGAATGSQIAVLGNGIATYTVVGTIGICESNTVALVTVEPAFSTAASNNGPTCEGNNVQLSVSNTGTAYAWSGPGDYNSSLNNPVLTNAGPSASGVYTVVVTAYNGCSLAVTTTVSVHPNPIVTVLGDTACTGQPATLTANGAITYSWTGPGSFFATGHTLELSASPDLAGSFTVLGSDENNCKAFSTTTFVVLPLPKGIITSSKDRFCAPACVTLHFTRLPGTGDIPYLNFFVDGMPSNNYAAHCFTTSGSFTAQAVFHDKNNCANTTQQILTVYPQPLTDFEYFPPEPIAGVDIVRFYNTTQGNDLDSFSWQFPGTSSNAVNQSYLFDDEGSYSIGLTVRNKWGCARTLEKTINVFGEFIFYIPNSFTPNGDRSNELFQPKMIHPGRDYLFEIFDRWGARIFSTEDPSAGWDGTYKNQECKVDTYVWKIHVVTSQGSKTYNYAGHVNLIR